MTRETEKPTEIAQQSLRNIEIHPLDRCQPFARSSI